MYRVCTYMFVPNFPFLTTVRFTDIVVYLRRRHFIKLYSWPVFFIFRSRPFSMGFSVSISSDNNITAGSWPREKSPARETDRGFSNKTRKKIGEPVESVTRKISLHFASLEKRFRRLEVKRSVRCKKVRTLFQKVTKKCTCTWVLYNCLSVN